MLFNSDELLNPAPNRPDILIHMIVEDITAASISLNTNSHCSDGKYQNVYFWLWTYGRDKPDGLPACTFINHFFVLKNSILYYTLNSNYTLYSYYLLYLQLDLFYIILLYNNY